MQRRTTASIAATLMRAAGPKPRGLGVGTVSRPLTILARGSAARILTARPAAFTCSQGGVTTTTTVPAARSFHVGTRVQRKDVPFLLADIGEGITECEVIQWFVKEGDRVEQFSPIAEVQSDKAAVEITSRYDGVIKKLHYAQGDVARVGQPLVDITTSDAADDSSSSSSSAGAVAAVVDSIKQAASPAVDAMAAAGRTVVAAVTADSTTAAMEEAYTLATPAVRRIARENRVDLANVRGTGPGGRILKGDILAFVAGTATPPPPTTAAAAAAVLAPHAKVAPAPTPAPITGDTTVPLGAIQKAMFKSMTRSLQIPHFGFSEEIILDATTAYRASINAHLKRNPYHSSSNTATTTAITPLPPVKKISYMPIFIKALSMALNEFPILNARLIHAEEGPAKAQLQYRAAHNIGVAMDTPQGLLVPNVKNAHLKSILAIAADLERLKHDGARNALSAHDLADGTITLSNIGNIGGTLLHPVLVASQLCIGAVGRIQTLPRFASEHNDTTHPPVVRATQVLNVSFNADHRVVDGATLARFVALWKMYLEHPATMAAAMR
ncbi:2-oxoacid dehydrogenases acyltransferase-domain-containing protein [Powellomyces hirtus]|nr:2-oxoacid dehydrogenases acyltransferase-domain-containing protein [Powellomyces hirtus]